MSLLLRALLPVGVLAVGVYAYSVLSVELEEEKAPPAAKQLIRTKVTELHVGDYSVVVKTNGIVQPHNQITLSAEVSGRITRIDPRFEVGAYFSAGDVLVELDERDYQSALAVAHAQHKLAESAYELAEKSFRRMERLSRNSSASILELDQAMATKTQTRAELDVATSQIEQAERDLGRTKIVAPFDGRIQQKSVGLGQLVSPGTALGDLFAVDYAEVRLPLSSRDLRFLDLPEMEGDEAVLVELRDAIDNESESVWSANIVRTEGTLDQDSLELFAIARVDDPFGFESGDPVLRIGQPIIATIRGARLSGVVAIPRGAVRKLNQVYLVDKDELTLGSLTIDPLWTDAEHVVVRDPTIVTGDLLATTQLVYAPEGSRVEIIPDAIADDESDSEIESEEKLVAAEVKDE